MASPLRVWLSIVVFAAAGLAQTGAPVDLRNLAETLNFERGSQPSGLPVGWGGPQDKTVVADNQTVHGGKWSARIERNAERGNSFSTLTYAIPINFSGAEVELRGFVRRENVSDFVGLWMREDGDTPNLAFDNMASRQLNGTADWTEYATKLPLRSEAKQLYFGFLLSGTGKAWIDDFQLLIDGKPVWEAPKRERPMTPIDLDHEFDRGSGIRLTSLTPLQIESLAVLGKAWGFLKYYHPAITSGTRQWDYDLFRVLPSILIARDSSEAKTAILQWVTSLGPVADCRACAGLSGNIQMQPDVDWITAEDNLGKELSSALMAIYRNRLPNKQFYVSEMARGVGNPIFDEPAYKDVGFPDAGFQILALYRFWNIVEYWAPYRDVLGEDWNAVLKEFVPRIALAKDSASYQLELAALISRVHDTHAALSNSAQIRPPSGACALPAAVRFVENQFVVTNSKVNELRAGDALLEMDGKPVSALVTELMPYYSGSNDAALKRNISLILTRGVCGDAIIRVRRENDVREIHIQRSPPQPQDASRTHELPGDTFRLLSPEVGYIKISAAKTGEVPRYIESAAGTKGMVIDIRSYPSDSTLYALGGSFVDREVPFVRFTFGDLSNPGAFYWGDSPVSLRPQKPHYAGKVVILVDELTQSAAEYHAMAFRASPNAIVIGGTTAGADGNVSPLSLPGGLQTQITGIGVFYPDKRPTQRVGIVPDIVVTPTIAGIRDGRDEVLEFALGQILGPDVTAERIRALIKQ